MIFIPFEVTPGPLPLCVAPRIEDSHQIFSAECRPHLAGEVRVQWRAAVSHLDFYLRYRNTAFNLSSFWGSHLYLCVIRTYEHFLAVFSDSYLIHPSQSVGMSKHDSQFIPLLQRTLEGEKPTNHNEDRRKTNNMTHKWVQERLSVSQQVQI